jgi:regulator of sigma E protease
VIVAGIIIGILILTALVTVHELGHYLAAKRSGVVVKEFGIGLPPTAWKKRLKNGETFSLNWLPIGGFCRMKGENDTANKEGDYGRATLWQKTKILFAGVAFNWLASIVIFMILAWVGFPKIFDHQFTVPSDTQVTRTPTVVVSVVDGSPASKAGLKQGDELVSIAGKPIVRSSDVSDISAAEKGRQVEINYVRDGEAKSTKAALNAKNTGKGFLGLSSGQNEYLHSTWSAPVVGVGMTVQLTAETFKGLGNLLVDFVGGLAKQLSFDEQVRQSGQDDLGEAANGVAGPVGIVGVLFPQAAQSGAVSLLFLAGVISLSLAVMNILPIPALDGGRWLLTMIFRLRHRKLTKAVEEKIVGISFLVLLGLVLLITIVDIARFF